MGPSLFFKRKDHWAFFVVYNTLGFGFLETVYERAIYVALRNRGVHVERQVPFEIYFEGDLVGRHRADLLVEHRVVVEVKATHALQEGAKRQLLNYVTALNLDLGLLLHFGPRAHQRQRLFLDLPHALASNAEQRADLLERHRLLAIEPEVQAQDL